MGLREGMLRSWWAAPLLSVGVTGGRVPAGRRGPGDALVPVPLVGSRGLRSVSG